MMKNFFLTLFYSLSSILCAYSQFNNWKITPPLNFETTLSGSYAELRQGHFHGGLDFRTGGMENKPVYAIDEGYIARINISPRGYGKAVYINHPNGYTTLYGHLNGFVPELDAMVKKLQYEKRTFEIEITFQPEDYPIRRGEQFAVSGNTGSSGGPHLHFEIRKTDDEILCNPLLLNRYLNLQDDRPPRILGVKIYGMNEMGLVNGAQQQKFVVETTKAKKQVLRGGNDIKVWGEIGFAIKANDYMTGTNFKHTPRTLKLFVDNELVSEVKLENIKLTDSRALNSFVDYPHLMQTGEFFMKFFPDANSPLTVFKQTKNNGVYTIAEEKPYAVRMEVFDDFGLSDEISFTIEGKQTEIPVAPKKPRYLLSCRNNESHLFERKDFLFFFPENALYTDIDLRYRKTEDSTFYSSVHEIGNNNIPLHVNCDISIKVTNDTVTDKRKYFIAKLKKENGIFGSAGGTYINGFMVGKTVGFGKFAVAIDTVAPTITPLNTTELNKRPFLQFKILDDLSGIGRYDGYIDGKWALFEMDAKTNTITYWLTDEDKKQNREHDVKIEITDLCGNKAEFEKTVFF